MTTLRRLVAAAALAALLASCQLFSPFYEDGPEGPPDDLMTPDATQGEVLPTTKPPVIEPSPDPLASPTPEIPPPVY
jgi:hypothetical protein